MDPNRRKPPTANNWFVPEISFKLLNSIHCSASAEPFRNSRLYFVPSWSIPSATHLPCVERVPKPSVKGGFSRLRSCGIAFSAKFLPSRLFRRVICRDQLQILEAIVLSSPLGKDHQVFFPKPEQVTGFTGCIRSRRSDAGFRQGAESARKGV